MLLQHGRHAVETFDVGMETLVGSSIATISSRKTSGTMR